MATGDLTNNIRKLQKELKKIKYTETLDLVGFSEGKATSLLPIYHYVFTSYSHAIAELISKADVELYGKTDMRFIEASYKILRDLFNYKPPITKEQFFNAGFAERKIIMCTQVLQKVQEKNKQLLPMKKSATSAISVIGQTAGVNRMRKSKSAVLRPLSAESLSGGLCSASSQKSSADSERSSHIHSSTPQVVNELYQPVMPTSPMQRHLAPHPHHMDNCETMSQPCQKSPPAAEVVTLSPRVTKEVLPHNSHSVENPRGFNWAVITPSIAKVKSMRMDNPVSNQGHPLTFDEEEEEDEDDNSGSDIETVNAVTPSQSIMEPPMNENWQKQIDALSELVGGTQEKIGTLETLLRSCQIPPQTDHILQQVLSQIETLTAKMVLVENRVSILESKLQTMSQSDEVRSDAAAASVHHCVTSHNHGVSHTMMKRDNIFNTNRGNSDKEMGILQELSHKNSCPTSHSFDPSTTHANAPKFESQEQNKDSEEKDVFSASQITNTSSIGLSPIRQALGTPPRFNQTNEDTFAMSNAEIDTRRSSTPTRHVEGDTELILGESMSLNVDNTLTREQVDRIKSMFKSTEIMLKQK